MIDSLHNSDDQIVAVLDLETTGLSSYFDRICEVGIVQARGEEILDTYQTLVNPQRPISPGAARVNRLSDEQVAQAPFFAQIAEVALSRLDGVPVICHNAPFDLAFMLTELSRISRSWEPFGVIDTLEIARRYFRFNSNSLPYLADRLGIENLQAHSALGDAMTTFHVFRKFYNRLMDKGTPEICSLVGSYHSPVRRTDQVVLPPEIREGLSEGKTVEITYLDAEGNQTCRVITPRQVLALNDAVYLVAYCHLRQAERNFRLDRIIKIGLKLMDSELND